MNLPRTADSELGRNCLPAWPHSQVGISRLQAAFPRQKMLMTSRMSTSPSTQRITPEAIILLLISISVAKSIDNEYVLIFFNKKKKHKNTANIWKARERRLLLFPVNRCFLRSKFLHWWPDPFLCYSQTSRWTSSTSSSCLSGTLLGRTMPFGLFLDSSWGL